MLRSLAPLALFAASLGGIAWCGALAWIEWDAIETIDELTRVEAAQSPEQRALELQALVGRIDARPPPFGGTPNAWHARSRAHLLAAMELARTQPSFLEALGRAEAAARESLRRRPANHGPWSNLTTIDVLRDGELGAQGLDALDRARLSAPYQAELALWRFQFSVMNWSRLPEAARDAALADAAVVWRDRPDVLVEPARAAPPAIQEALIERIPELAERL